MERSARIERRPLIALLWPLLFLGIGLFRLADWVYGGRQDLGLLLSGIGFVLMAPGATAISQPKAQPPARSRRAGIFLALSVAGAALVLAAIAKRWL
jgi:hypothetical protein